VAAACQEIEAAKLDCALMVDCSHANSAKQYERQVEVARDVAQQLRAGSQCIFGVMVESHLQAGSQKFVAGRDDPAELEYGKSITDACLGWPQSLEVLDVLSQPCARAPSCSSAADRARRAGGAHGVSWDNFALCQYTSSPPLPSRLARLSTRARTNSRSDSRFRNWRGSSRTASAEPSATTARSARRATVRATCATAALRVPAAR